MIFLSVISVVFAGCREKTDLEKLTDYWAIEEIEGKRVRITFWEPHEEGYVRNTFGAQDVTLSIMEQEYGEFKPSAEGNVCGDMAFTIWDRYLREDKSVLLDNERELYGIYEQDSIHKTVTLNILIDREHVIVESKKYRYEFEDRFHMALIDLENPSERIELQKET